jgi:hypothetical protein
MGCEYYRYGSGAYAAQALAPATAGLAVRALVATPAAADAARRPTPTHHTPHTTPPLAPMTTTHHAQTSRARGPPTASSARSRRSCTTQCWRPTTPSSAPCGRAWRGATCRCPRGCARCSVAITCQPRRGVSHAAAAAVLLACRRRHTHCGWLRGANTHPPTRHQTLAYEKILGGLAAGGLLRGDVQDMIAAEVGGIFMPHGGLGGVRVCVCVRVCVFAA